jgi:hypothetical protein
MDQWWPLELRIDYLTDIIFSASVTPKIAMRSYYLSKTAWRKCARSVAREKAHKSSIKSCTTSERKKHEKLHLIPRSTLQSMGKASSLDVTL